MSENSDVVAAWTNQVLADDGGHAIAKSRNNGKDIAPKRAEVKSILSEEIRVQSEEDPHDTKKNSEIVGPEVAHLEPNNGHERGCDYAQHCDHCDARYQSHLKSLDAGIESKGVKYWADKVSPLGVGSISWSLTEEEEHHEKVSKHWVEDRCAKMSLIQFLASVSEGGTWRCQTRQQGWKRPSLREALRSLWSSSFINSLIIGYKLHRIKRVF